MGASDPLRRPVSTGWFPDPLRRFEFRYFNGERWTADVSVDGTRFVDPHPFAPPPSTGSGRPPDRHPSRTLAMLSFVLGLAGLALAWAPFIFVLGGAGAAAAIVLGIVSLRRTKRLRAQGIPGDGSRRGLAIAAVCLGPAGLGLCAVGVVLTGAAYREFDDYTNPGPYSLDESTCTVADGRATFAGTITNLDDRERDYELLLELLAGSEVLARDRVEVDDVAPGSSESWATEGRVGHVDVECRVRGVRGPYPFGLDPNG